MNYTCIGNYEIIKAGHTEHYFMERYSFMDYRGRLRISPKSIWGYGNAVITATHDISSGEWTEPMVLCGVTVEDYAWITSMCVLYNCTIGHHAIVSVGSVVSQMVVEPYTVVSGNPARVVARWDGERWKATGG